MISQDICQISVVIPTYNRPTALAQCLRGLALQEYPHDHYEIIVVDDGGEVELDVTLKSAGHARIRLIRQDNRGPAAARNFGVAEARTPFIAFTDDDCIPDAGWLNALACRLQQEPDSMVGGQIVNGLTKNRFSNASQAIIDKVYNYYNIAPIRAKFFATNNMALARKEFTALGGLDERFRTSEDRNFCDRWAASGRPMFYEKGAIVQHYHELTLRGFLWQHFNYGRGTYIYYHDRVGRGQPSFRLGSFREKLFGSIWLWGGDQNLGVSLLIACSQIASLAGFYMEWIQRNKLLTHEVASRPRLPRLP